MKNLSDELKKLNTEYEVSNDFKDKVMKKVKEDSKSETLTSFYNVISKIAYAVAAIVICTIFIHKSEKNITMDSTSYDTSLNEAIPNDRIDLHKEENSLESMLSPNVEKSAPIEVYDMAARAGETASKKMIAMK